LTYVTFLALPGRLPPPGLPLPDGGAFVDEIIESLNYLSQQIRVNATHALWAGQVHQYRFDMWALWSTRRTLVDTVRKAPGAKDDREVC